MLGLGLMRPTKYDNNSTTQNIPPNSWIQTCSNNTGNICIGAGSIIGLCKDNLGVINVWNESKVTQIRNNSSRIEIGSGSWIGMIAFNTGTINLGEHCHVDWIVNNSGTITAGRFSTLGRNADNMMGAMLLPGFPAEGSPDGSWQLCGGKKRQSPDSRYLRSLPVPSGGNQGFEIDLPRSSSPSKGYPTEGSNDDLNRAFYQYQIKAVRRSPLSVSASFTSGGQPSIIKIKESSRNSKYTTTAVQISFESRSSFSLNVDSERSCDGGSLERQNGSSDSTGTPQNDARTPTPLSEDLEAKCCAICLERPRDVAFNCGHISCQECSQHLNNCHICRELITSRQKLYTN